MKRNRFITTVLSILFSLMVSSLAMAAVRMPVASGSVTYGNAKVTIDASNASEGYIMIKYSGSTPKIKVQISKATVYTYDLNAGNSYEVFPLSEGSGSYSVKVYEQVSGNQYSQAFGESISANIANQFSPFLYPNQYVNFNDSTSSVQVANQLAATAGGDQVTLVNTIFDYVTNNFTYDNNKAATVKSGYLPNINAVMASKTGICFDYAAVMASMLRSQGVPTKLIVGYTGSVYHAWANVYIQGVGWVDNMIYFDGTNWKLLDPTFVSTGKESGLEYSANEANYQAKYSY